MKSHQPQTTQLYPGLTRTLPRSNFWNHIVCVKEYGKGLKIKFNILNIFMPYINSAEQRVNNLHISCNCCGREGAELHTYFVGHRPVKAIQSQSLCCCSSSIFPKDSASKVDQGHHVKVSTVSMEPLFCICHLAGHGPHSFAGFRQIVGTLGNWQGPDTELLSAFVFWI